MFMRLSLVVVPRVRRSYTIETRAALRTALIYSIGYETFAASVAERTYSVARRA